MKATIIRFPTAAKLGERPMATKLSWLQRFDRWLFGHEPPRANLARLRIERARRQAAR